jgi:hypothetical protein
LNYWIKKSTIEDIKKEDTASDEEKLLDNEADISPEVKDPAESDSDLSTKKSDHDADWTLCLVE